jgi:hypothetical protein
MDRTVENTPPCPPPADPDTLEPLISNEGWVYSMDVYRRLARMNPLYTPKWNDTDAGCVGGINSFLNGELHNHIVTGFHAGSMLLQSRFSADTSPKPHSTRSPGTRVDAGTCLFSVQNAAIYKGAKPPYSKIKV